MHACKVIEEDAITNHMWQVGATSPIDGGNSDDESNAPTYEGHYEALSKALQLGDNFVVNDNGNNEEGVYFYLINCTSIKEKLRGLEEDNWGNELEVGSCIVKGHFYK